MGKSKKERNVKQYPEKLELKKKSPARSLEINQPLKKRIALFSMLIIIMAGAFVYANSIHGKFLWDDEILIQDNKEIQSWSNLPRIFAENIGTGAGRDYNFYRPLHMLTLMVDYSLFKFDVEGYHLTNILFHILTALCIYILANLLFRHNALSLLTALLFVVHPIHTEVVTYISGRFDALSAFFMLLCIIFYIKNFKSSFMTIFLVSLCAILAILSKENALILPVLILLYHYIFGEFNFKKFIPLVAIAIIYIILRMTVLYFPGSGFQTPNTLWDRMPGFFVAVTNYITLLILPFNLHMEHGDLLFKFSDPKALIGILILAFAAFCVFKFRKSNKLLTFAILWFFICLLPESNLYRINAYMNEHWLYLPSFGFFLLLGKYLCPLNENGKLRIFSLIACVALLSFYSFLTIKQNTYWKDPVSFYERTLKYAPFSSRLYNNLARQYEMSGRYKEAVELYKKAVKIAPDYAEAYNNLGVADADLDLNLEAIDAYKTAIKLDPNLVGIYSNLGNAYGRVGKTNEAIEVFLKALKIKPDASAYNNLALIYRGLGKDNEAIQTFQNALDLDPDNNTVYLNIANTYASIGKAQEAIAAFKKVTQLDPNNANSYNNIGYLLKNLGRYEEAIPYFENALKINPGIPEAYENICLTYLKINEVQKAKEWYQRAIQIDPSNQKRYKKLLQIINNNQV